ncbi:mediator complex subunit 23-domain-containing protein [Chlamydoabsidia padenii]|nr:mediator complex subunit 23-domain-containing protein [Chlamydoabsidia padenii]
MESLRTVITRLFADAHDNTAPLNTPSFNSDYQAYHGLFSRKSPKRRRFHLLHPEIGQDPAIYDHSMIPVHTSHLDYDTLVNDFMRATQYGNINEPLKVILLKYREPPFLLTKTLRLLKFLHHLLQVVPITHPNKPFPFGHVLEDLTLTLSLRVNNNNNNNNPHLQQAKNDVAVYSTWIITIQFLLSCLRNNSPHHLYNAGVTTPVILGAIKHILLELTRMPTTSAATNNNNNQQLELLQRTSFDTGQELLELFLVRPGPSDTPVGTVSYYDVIYSFPELYGHFLNAAPSTVIPQPSITNPDRIPTVIAINVIKHILREINTLPPNLSTLQAQCLNKGKELINLLLIGPSGDGVGVVEYYDIILALPDVYGHFLHGTFAQSVHWTMEKFVNELGKRRRHLAFLMMPPDASWPLISQLSRRHEFNDLTTRTSYHMFEGDLIEFVKEGNSTNIETHFRDMLFQRASMDEFRQLVMSLTQTGLDTTLIRKAMVSKVRDVIQCMQHYSSSEKRDVSDEGPFNIPSANHQVRGEDIKMVIPNNISMWELMTETADQLYSFVAADFFSYEDILHDFYKLIYNDDDEPYPAGTKNHINKDNSLVWLLLQLFYIDRVSTNVIEKDFEKDERLFGKFVKLYNEDQMMTKDGFSLRDLSLQCAINHQKDHIKDITNIKQRHPGVSASLRYATLCYQIQAYFSNHYHSHVPTNSTLFQNMNLQEMTVVGLECQLRQDIVPYALYVYLVPTKPDIRTLGHPAVTFVKGGSLSYKLLDLLSINAKHRLLQVIYKMMLDSELGPRYQANNTPVIHNNNNSNPSSIPSSPPPPSQQKSTAITCVPPYVLDVVYKLLYSAPCSAELMIKEIFDKLRRCDKLIKLKRNGDPSISASTLKNNDTPFPDQTMRWMHTMLQLINYRFIRLLKYSPLSAGMFHYVRYSISYLEHRQVYQVLESFVLNTTRSQVDVKLLRSLDDPNRDKPIWFAESEKLARAMVYHIARLIKTRGQADIKTEQIHRVLAHLYEYKLQWSPETLAYFPEAVRSFYLSPKKEEEEAEQQQQSKKANMVRPAVFMAMITPFVQSNQAFISFISQGITENERGLLQYFSTLEHQPLILCSLWLFAVMRFSMDVFHMPSVRKLLLVIPPSRMATCVIDFIDFVLSMDYSAPNSLNLAFQLLDTMIWKHQWVNLNDVILALLNGNSTGDRAQRSFDFIRHLLLQSPEFDQRIAKWDSLNFSHRSWTEEDNHDKLMAYHKTYPEYYEFEAFSANNNNNNDELDPPLQTPMPIYHTNLIVDFVTCMESIIAHLIEHNQHHLLADILDKYGHLFCYHQYPLSFVCNVLLYYHEALKNHPLLVKRIARLLDFDQYDIAPEAVAYALEDSVVTSAFNSSYFDRIVYKLSGNLNPQKCAPRTKENLPERHFREIGSPAIEGISTAILEIMLTPIPPETVIQSILNLTLLRESHYVGVSALTIHAVGLLISSLPPQTFLRPVFGELNRMIKTHPSLLEVSEPCRLIRCSVPKRANGKYVMSQSLPDLTTTAVLKDSMSARFRKAMMFPYIFNDYTFNLHNYSTNVPNTFLTLFHSVLHYSSLDGFTLFLEYLRSLRVSGKLRTDVQLLYVCFLLGPALHRIEKLETTDAEFMIELMNIVKQVTVHMDMKDGWVTQALEQVFDFLYHIRARFVKSPELVSQLRNIIKTMNPPISQRLLRLVM